MNIQNIKLNSINQVKFSGIQVQPKPEQVVQEEKKVPLNYDTARAYAEYSIIKSEYVNKTDKTNNEQSKIPVDRLFFVLSENKDKNDKNFEVKIANLRYKNLGNKFPKGMMDIQKMRDWIFKVENEKLDGISNCKSLSESQHNATILKTNNLSKGFDIAMKHAYDTECNEKDFKIVKFVLKKYYRDFWNKKQEFYCNDFKDAKSLEEINEQIDKITFEDYKKFLKDYKQIKNAYIEIKLPSEVLNDKQKMAELEKSVTSKFAVETKYNFLIKNK